MLGFITSLNDILIPHLRAVFTLNYVQAMLIQFCFFGAYLIMSFPAGLLVGKLGYKSGIVCGLVTAGTGCLLFFPAAGSGLYPFFLCALFVLASGMALLQVAANPYVAVLGKPELASSRLNLTQGFNSLGTTLAPFFGSVLILSGAVKTSEELQRMAPAALATYNIAQAGAVKAPYVGLAVVFYALAVAIALFKLPRIEDASRPIDQPDSRSSHGAKESAWAYRHLVLGAVAIFLYVGAEVGIGSFLVNFMGQPGVAGLQPDTAARYLSLYWGGAMVGRFIGSALMSKVRPGLLLALNALVVIALLTVAILTSGTIAMWSLLLIGLFNSIMFPTIFTLAIDGLGKHTVAGSGILCMAIVGGAIVPLVQGFLADHIGIQWSFCVPAICYLYIAYYGQKGHCRFSSARSGQLAPCES
ncbi:sugar MFS transporter [Burkholderia sp. Ax-1719]|nr:sugar MFS transporter [Burkholderia sp. Ax-1719]